MAHGRYNLHALPSGLATDGEPFARVHTWYVPGHSACNAGGTGGAG